MAEMHGSRPQNEFGLAGIFDNVRDGLVLVRFPKWEVVLFNRAASEMCGIPVEKALGGRFGALFVDAEVQATVKLCSEQPLGEWPGHFQAVMRAHFTGHATGKGVDLHFCRVDPVGTNGPLVLLVMRPSPEAELEQAVTKGTAARLRVEELEVEARAHALFFNEAAHEFNTPLTVVALQAQLLQGALGPIAPNQEHALDIINANVHRLVLLSQDLVDLARADAGKLLAKSVPFDLFALVGEEVENFKALAQQNKVAVAYTASQTHADVVGEPGRLRQVLGNFLGNAVKFTPPGGRVTVGVSVVADAAFVHIQDTGPGMDAADQARLFRPFVRIDNPDAPKKPGNGLGLYLSKRIVEAHGGKVGSTSEGRGKGMTFWFKLPLASPASPAGSAERVPGRRPTSSRRSARPPRAKAAPHARAPVATPGDLHVGKGGNRRAR